MPTPAWTACATRRWAVPMRSTSWRCGARISPPPPGKRPPPTIGSGGAARRATRTGRARRTRTPRGSGKASNQDWASPTDPDARVMQHADGHTHLSYRAGTTVDLETGVIVTADAELANVSDQADFLFRVDEAVETLAERGLTVAAVVADK